MARSYIKHNDIFFVPILRQQVSFAVLVQRAVAELCLDERDLIAVALPDSLRVPIQEAIGKLPTISFITSSIKGMSHREVFPVSPADGMVEAIRIAKEQEIPLLYIDQEVPPGHLINKHCINFQDWPDDELALERGIEWYFSLIQERLSNPPARFEPVDTWRERYMAEQLRRNYPMYRNILVICHAAHVNPIKRYINDQLVLFEPDKNKLFNTRLKVSEPSLAILLRYLGDIPRLVELYEIDRREGRAQEFNKLKALMNSIHQIDKTGFDFSIRNYQAFVQLLRQILEFQQRISPGLDEILLACISCFNKPFERRVYRYLLGYFDQVEVKRIVYLIDTKEEIAEIQASVEELSESYVARSCSLTPTREFQIFDPPRPPRTSSIGKQIVIWPHWADFIQNKTKKAIELANQNNINTKLIPFQGSLYNGIDFRRTLRSYLNPVPTIYVKKNNKSVRRMFSNDEPIVWLYNLQESDSSDFKFSLITYSFKELSQYGAFWTSTAFIKEENFGNDTLIIDKVLGMVVFPLLTIDFVKKTPGSKIRENFPVNEDFYEDYKYGQIPSQLVDQFNAGCPWWEVMILGAAKYAKKDILCIMPPDIEIPNRIICQVNNRGKTLHRLSLSRFTIEERQKMKTSYSVESNYIPKFKKEDFDNKDFKREMENRFGFIMEQYWE